ncbi:CPBP family intramembrane metalloprotease [Acetobacter senegalensis]|uniref:CPBP family intramembrane glutamic endopeptidase n=1 Tax=Acetobacter senegalensis TaxID=446692 RepID=UPI0020A1EFB8|nr:CPBP family intramembrane metalloprotease [Acetobacter senegalensis]
MRERPHAAHRTARDKKVRGKIGSVWPAALYFLIIVPLVLFIHNPHVLAHFFTTPVSEGYQKVLALLDFILTETLMFLAVLAVTAVFARLDRKDAAFCGLPLQKAGGQRFLYGCALSTIGMLLLGVFEYAFGGFHITGWIWPPAITLLITLLSAFWVLLVALTEELWFRGYALAKLEGGMGWWCAAITTSLVFSLCHLHNQGENYSELVLIFLSGMLLCGLRRLSGSLWLGIGAHATADLAGIILGVPGHDMANSPMQIVYLETSGSALINGGENGVMFSLPGIACQFLMMLVPILLVRPSRQHAHGDALPPSA